VDQSRRLPSLDGWRAVAILMVVMSHFTATRGFDAPWWWTTAFQGNLGVRIFFVISGLLITYLLLIEADRRGRPSLKLFYTRRVLRIFPVYFLYLGVIGTLAVAGLYSDTTTAWLASFTFLRNFIGKNDSLTGHYWSLAVEEQFYLVWPVMVVVLRLWERRGLAIGLLLVPIVLSPVCRTGVLQTYWSNALLDRALNAYSTAFYADSLAVGCLGAFAFFAFRESLKRAASGWLLGVALAAFGLAAVATGRAGAVEPLVPLIEAAAILCAIVVTIDRRSGVIYRLLNTGPMVWLGVLSYSVYVWQELFVSWAAGPKLSAFAVYDWRVWWMPAIACACASYYLVERPILRIRDRYEPISTGPAREGDLLDEGASRDPVLERVSRRQPPREMD
jgi:peptidoglycan/LPS O-acetylase OafA/YrhL